MAKIANNERPNKSVFCRMVWHVK